MAEDHLIYPLVDGFIHHWLRLGPCDTGVTTTPVSNETALAFRTRLLPAAEQSEPDFVAPCELDRFACEDGVLFWEVEACADDHFLDWSGFVARYTDRRGWAYASLACPTPTAVTFQLTTTCPTRVWLNGASILYAAHRYELTEQTAHQYTVTAQLQAGVNHLLLRCEQVALGDVALAVALRVESVEPASIQVLLPTVTAAAAHRQALEQTFALTALDRAVYTRNDAVQLLCSPQMTTPTESLLRLQHPTGAIYADTVGVLGPGVTLQSVRALQLPAGPMQATLLPPFGQFYDEKVRARRTFSLWVAHQPDHRKPAGSYDQRLVEAIQVAARREQDIYAEIAKMALGAWQQVAIATIEQTIARVNRCEADSLPDLLGLLGMRQRMVHYAACPPHLPALLDACIGHFMQRHDFHKTIDLTHEANQLLLAVCQLLAGQLLATEPVAAFPVGNLDTQGQAEEALMAWLRQRAQVGFALWDSHNDLLVLALAHLADLAATSQVREWAAVLLDKVLFGIAVHGLDGMFGSTRGAAQGASLRSTRFAPEAALSRLLWGTGSYDSDLRAVVSLGLAGKNYTLPPLIQAIALDRAPAVWVRERHQMHDFPAQVLSDDGQSVTKVTYKTPDYLLSSAQDYRPGQPGRAEQIWQATLAPEALVFTNHPTAYSQSDSRVANWWRGNGVLPRVAQWHDALIVLYQLPGNDWLGFTHAYFPLYAFDEHQLTGNWAFARVGHAYLALYAARGLTLMQHGPDAYRELRSPGLSNVWLCQMGRRAVDGSFSDFCRQVLSRPPLVDSHPVVWQTIRQERLAFGWREPFAVDGHVQPHIGFRHHESPYGMAELPAATMDITLGQEMMRLHFR